MKKVYILLFICLLCSSLSAQVRNISIKRPLSTIFAPKDGAHLSKLLSSINFNKEVTTSAGASQSNLSDLPSDRQNIIKAGIINTNYTTNTSNVNTSVAVPSGGGVYPVVPQPIYNSSMYNSSTGNSVSSGGHSSSSGGMCQLCAGSGDCRTCMGLGYYYSSFGSGKLPCPNCDRNHNGRCSSCHGTRKR